MICLFMSWGHHLTQYSHKLKVLGFILDSGLNHYWFHHSSILGLSPKYEVSCHDSEKHLLSRLQLIQNYMKYEGNEQKQIIPVLAGLHWLPVSYRVNFKILLLAYKIHFFTSSFSSPKYFLIWFYGRKTLTYTYTRLYKLNRIKLN